MKQFSTSIRIYSGLIFLLVLVKLLFVIFPVAMPVAGNEAAFSPLTILIIAVMGLLGLLMARRTGFPEILDERISNRQRFLIPCVIGLVYGLATVAPLLLGNSNRVHPLAVSADIHVKFPFSIPYYTYGALFLEIFLRLFCVSLLVWLISNVILRGRGQTAAFWFAALVVAMYEPMPYLMQDFANNTAAGSVWVILKTVAGPLFISNVAAAYLFRRYGFLAPFVMRLSHYLIWHIIYGGLT
ncbi:MAG TPA: hypothetical protein VNO50_11585 [Pyrinomonadaceae bacterium]|nr:hypothetical protein [Pyrinomonadaceae bacterium]